MSDKTGIEWTEATWNPTTGCHKVSPGCKNCYAKRDWARLSKNPKTVYFGREFEDVQTHSERLDQPLRWTRPRLIFVNSMSDLFHKDVPFHFIDEVFSIMRQAKHHTFQVLTKRPERMLEWCWSTNSRHGDLLGHFWPGNSNPPKNIWLGVSCEDQATANERIPFLLQVPAAVRWLSCEPLLGPIDIFSLDGPIDVRDGAASPIHWVVAGGESGSKARLIHPNWVRSLRGQCDQAGVPFFFKQWGEWLPVGPDDLQPATFSDKQWLDHDHAAFRVGKAAAGRLLDGIEYSEYPTL